METAGSKEPAVFMLMGRILNKEAAFYCRGGFFLINLVFSHIS